MYLQLLLISALLLPDVSFAFEPGDWMLSRRQGNQYQFPGSVQRVEGGRVTVVQKIGPREESQPGLEAGAGMSRAVK